jgi:hypothetical protein
VDRLLLYILKALVQIPARRPILTDVLRPQFTQATLLSASFPRYYSQFIIRFDGIQKSLIKIVKQTDCAVAVFPNNFLIHFLIKKCGSCQLYYTGPYI